MMNTVGSRMKRRMLSLCLALLLALVLAGCTAAPSASSSTGAASGTIPDGASVPEPIAASSEAEGPGPDIEGAYAAYRKLLREDRYGIIAYDWQWGIEEASLPKQVALCDITGDGVPKLFCFSVPIDEYGHRAYDAWLNICTWENGGAIALYSQPFDLQAGGGVGWVTACLQPGRTAGFTSTTARVTSGGPIPIRSISGKPGVRSRPWGRYRIPGRPPQITPQPFTPTSRMGRKSPGRRTKACRMGFCSYSGYFDIDIVM